jgi:uncharacterized membrane protein (UPF0136 family)
MNLIIKLVVILLFLVGTNGLLGFVQQKCYTSYIPSTKVGARQFIAAAFKPAVDRLMILSMVVFGFMFMIYSTMPVIFDAVPAAFRFFKSAYKAFRVALDAIISAVKEVVKLLKSAVDTIKNISLP